MFSRTRRPLRRATLRTSGTAPSEVPWNTTSAAVWLTSAAVAGDIETSAAASAGASLSPSPTISTLAPLAPRDRRASGTSPRASCRPANPRCRAPPPPRAPAPRRSPDSSSTSLPARLAAAATTAAASGRSASLKPNRTGAASGPGEPQLGIAVLVAGGRRGRRKARGCRGGSRRSAARRLRPSPGCSSTPSAAGTSGRGAAQRAAQRMPAARRQTSRRRERLRHRDRRPAAAPAARGSACRSCRRRPYRPRPAAPARSPISAGCRARNRRPLAITCTAGTARPSAQGQVMISTATAFSSACLPGAPTSTQPQEGRERQQMHRRRVAPRHAVGEHDEARAAAARPPRSAARISARSVRVAGGGRRAMRSGAARLSVPASTALPGATGTGRLSPSTRLVSTAERARGDACRRRRCARPPPPARVSPGRDGGAGAALRRAVGRTHRRRRGARSASSCSAVERAWPRARRSR